MGIWPYILHLALSEEHKKAKRSWGWVRRYLGQHMKESAGARVFCRDMGHIHADLDAFLGELSVLASQKQRDVGQNPTRWLSKWRTEISLQLAISVGEALVAAVPPNTRPICISEPTERTN